MSRVQSSSATRDTRVKLTVGQEENGTPKDPRSDHQAAFSDDYKEKREMLATGSRGQIFCATRHDGRRSAVKIFVRRDLRATEERRLRKEVQLFRDLKNPHIPELHGWYEDDDAFYMALELCEGGELLECTASKESYTEQKARDIMVDILRLVKYFHSLGITIRGLKVCSQDIRTDDRSENAQLKLVNLRYATRDAPSDHLDLDLRAFPEYVAPEILESKRAGLPADIWSVGVIAYVLVGGYLPFGVGDVDRKEQCDRDPIESRTKEEQEKLRKWTREEVEFHKEKWQSISQKAVALIRRMLTVAPDSRITVDEALRHEWVTLQGTLLATKNLYRSQERLRAFITKRAWRSAIYSAVMVAHGLSGSTGAGEAGRAYRLAEEFTRERPALRDERNRETPSDAQEVSSLPTDESVIDASHKSCDEPSQESTESASNVPLHVSPPTLHETLSELSISHTKCDEAEELRVRVYARSRWVRKPKAVEGFEIQESMAIEDFKGKGYFARVVAKCPPSGASLSTRRLVLFFLRPGTPSWRSSPELDEVLTDSQVLYKIKPSDDWQSVPRNQLRLVRSQRGENSETYLQAKVDRFHSIGYFRRADTNSRFSFGLQRNKGQVVIRNVSRATMYVLLMPARIYSREMTVEEVSYDIYSPNSGERSLEGGTSRTEKVARASSLEPSCKTLLPDQLHKFDLGKHGDFVRFIMCTLEDLPHSEGQRGGSKILKIWDSLNAYGGRDIAILPAFTHGEWQRSVVVDSGNASNLWRVVLTLDGVCMPVAQNGSP